jgi:hypothetical protein
MPTEVIRDRIRRAYATGELVESDYLRYDTHRGFHQFNDCSILQMIAIPDSSRVGRALGPTTYSMGEEEPCRTLRELVLQKRDAATLSSSRYTRYWHGYIPLIALLLSLMELSTVRVVLRVLVYVAVLLLPLSSLRNRRFLLLTGPVAAAGIFFWGLPYFGQGMSHAPGDSVVMLGITYLIIWHRKLVNPGSLVPYCALFGAVIVYLEMLTGLLPTAAGLLFPTVYVVSRLNYHADLDIGDNFGLAIIALLAFAFGAVFTVGARVIVAAALVNPNGLDAFAGNLEFYTQDVDSIGFVPGFLVPLGRLLRKGVVLTYGSTWGLAAIYASVTLSWLGAILLAMRQGSHLAWADLISFMIGGASIPIWTFILPRHTFNHADFMVRILIVPMSLGWAAISWQLWLKYRTPPQTASARSKTSVIRDSSVSCLDSRPHDSFPGAQSASYSIYEP